jgi:hypothetical protein
LRLSFDTPKVWESANKTLDELPGHHVHTFAFEGEAAACASAEGHSAARQGVVTVVLSARYVNVCVAVGTSVVSAARRSSVVAEPSG